MLQVSLPKGVEGMKNACVTTPGMRFKALRQRKAFGQTGLAKAAGIKSDQAISNFELGISKKMHPDNWRAVAAAFELTVDELNEVVFTESSSEPIADDEHELLRDGETKVLVVLDEPGKAFIAGYKASGMRLIDYFNQKLREMHEAEKLTPADPTSAEPAGTEAPKRKLRGGEHGVPGPLVQPLVDPTGTGKSR